MQPKHPSGLLDHRDEPCVESTSDEPERRDHTGHDGHHSVDEREATELPAYCDRPVACAVATPPPEIWLSRFWKRNVSLTVPHDACRDHLANERTFLAYLRTSLALSMIGATTTQLFRIQLQAAIYPTKIGYFTLGIPLGAAFQIAAMIMVAIACHRYLRQQMSMARGKVWASGWELYVVMGGVFMLLTVLFVLMVGAEKIPRP